MNEQLTTRRILIVDDMPDIHEDFKKVLSPTSHSAQLNDLESELFGIEKAVQEITFTLDSVFQGEQALKKVKDAIAEGHPYDLAFIDMRMPPGWNGLETIEELRKVDPSLPVVTCTAFSDYTPEQICERIGLSEGYMYIRKPFEPDDVRMIAKSMSDRRVR